MKPLIRGSILGVFGLLCSAAVSAEDFRVNRMLASQCAQCHGTEGRAVGDMESLSEEGFKDLLEDLVDMRLEDMPEDIMEHQALGYTDDQIRRIAEYYGSMSGESGSSGEKKEDDEREERKRRRRGEDEDD